MLLSLKEAVKDWQMRKMRRRRRKNLSGRWSRKFIRRPQRRS